ncbi:6854_t:CDS:2, partial [Cetraspora pellucida]
LSSGLPPFKNVSDQTEIALHVINGKRETPIDGTPVDFMKIYCDAWNGNPNLRPSIAEIYERLKNIRIVPQIRKNSAHDAYYNFGLGRTKILSDHGHMFNE